MIPPFPLGERRPFALALPPTAPWEVAKMALLWPLAVVRIILIAFVLACAWLLSFPTLCCQPHGRAWALWLLPIRLLLRSIAFINGFYWIPVVHPPSERVAGSDARNVVPASFTTTTGARCLIFACQCLLEVPSPITS